MSVKTRAHQDFSCDRSAPIREYMFMAGAQTGVSTVPSQAEPQPAAEVVHWDTFSFELFYDQHAPAVYRYIYFRTGMDRGATAELVAEVFLALWTLDKPPADEAAPVLYGIVRRKLADFFRHRERRREIRFADLSTGERDWVAGMLSDHDDESKGPEHLSESARVLIGEVLSSLETQAQELLVGKYFRYLSVRELAKAHGKTEAAITSALARARQTFRESFEARMKG
jgi:RNA polymerase sigma factor (sigma-70 family)